MKGTPEVLEMKQIPKDNPAGSQQQIRRKRWPRSRAEGGSECGTDEEEVESAPGTREKTSHPEVEGEAGRKSPFRVVMGVGARKAHTVEEN